MSGPLATAAPCPHQRIEAIVDVCLVVNSPDFIAELRVRCSECGVRFQFAGTTQFSADRLTLLAPFVPVAVAAMPGHARADHSLPLN